MFRIQSKAPWFVGLEGMQGSSKNGACSKFLVKPEAQECEMPESLSQTLLRAIKAGSYPWTIRFEILMLDIPNCEMEHFD